VAAGAPLREAVMSAARTRMRPILMTALATLAGLAPVAMVLEAGSETSAPLARAAIGGLAVSTVLTLVLVPTIYELLHSRREAGK
jgi:multidrug efflux pump subunit AcrB